MKNWLYNLLIYLTLPYALWRIYRRYGGAAIPWREYFGYCPLPRRGDKLFWIHAVSLGEAVAAGELAERLQAEGYRLLLTYTTPAGRNWLRRRYPDALITALPLDVLPFVRRFFSRCQPVAGIVMEAEYWYNLLTTAKQQGVSLMLANARLGRKNARRYRLVAGLMREMVCCYDVVAAQTARDAGRLRCYGARRVVTTGNLKFDLPLPPVSAPPILPDKPTLLFAATRRGEEEALLAAAAQTDFLREVFIVLAPRHPERRDEIAALLQQHRLRYQLRSVAAQPAADCQIYVADTLGEMALWYSCCGVAIIGGSFRPFGGQNPIEAMRAGSAAVTGPYMDNYRRLVRRAVAAGALWQVADAPAALKRAQSLLDDNTARQAMQKTAKEFCQLLGGALEQHLLLVRQLLAVIPERK